MDDFKPLTKRPKVTNGIKVSSEQIPARTCSENGSDVDYLKPLYAEAESNKKY